MQNLWEEIWKILPYGILYGTIKEGKYYILRVIPYLEGYYSMNEQKIIANRIKYYCEIKNMSFYTLAFRSTVPLTTLMHILNCSTKNPGVFTIAKICNGLDVTITEFFSSKEFEDMEFGDE